MNVTDYVMRQVEWSEETFGPGERNEGLSDHIRKELEEVKEDHEAGRPTAEEWVDVAILALDGLWRSLVYERHLDPETASVMAESMLDEKFLKNRAKKWPDRSTVEPDKAIEHVRANDE